MVISPIITFRNMDPVPTITAEIGERFAKLSQLHEILRCELIVEMPHRSHHKGAHFHVRIRLTVPGAELVADRDPSEHAAYVDVHVALRDAFESITRQIRAHRARQRGLAVAI
jgi:ribosome-associated translation inhibitor RaiA